MERKLFDNDNDAWSNEPKRDLWGSEEVEEQGSKALNFKFKVNPKMLGLLGAAVITIATLASILPDVIGGDNPSPSPTPSASKSSTPASPLGL